jgi:hypothetical protein
MGYVMGWNRINKYAYNINALEGNNFSLTG